MPHSIIFALLRRGAASSAERSGGAPESGGSSTPGVEILGTSGQNEIDFYRDRRKKDIHNMSKRDHASSRPIRAPRETH